MVGASGLVGQHVVGRLRARGHGVTSVARTYRVEMPIAEQICRVIYEGAPPREAVAALMGRAIKAETQ